MRTRENYRYISRASCHSLVDGLIFTDRGRYYGELAGRPSVVGHRGPSTYSHGTLKYLLRLFSRPASGQYGTLRPSRLLVSCRELHQGSSPYAESRPKSLTCSQLTGQASDGPKITNKQEYKVQFNFFFLPTSTLEFTKAYTTVVYNPVNRLCRIQRPGARLRGARARRQREERRARALTRCTSTPRRCRRGRSS